MEVICSNYYTPLLHKRFTDASVRADPSTEGSESSRNTATPYWAMLSSAESALLLFNRFVPPSNVSLEMTGTGHSAHHSCGVRRNKSSGLTHIKHIEQNSTAKYSDISGSPALP
jgi:hypothetical protein